MLSWSSCIQGWKCVVPTSPAMALDKYSCHKLARGDDLDLAMQHMLQTTRISDHTGDFVSKNNAHMDTSHSYD
jgi:hypothetical protein